MDSIATTGKVILAGTLYTIWVNYQQEVMKALTGKNTVARNEIAKNIKKLEALQENMYIELVHMNADKINEMKDDVDIQNQVKEAYGIYYKGLNMLNNDTQEEIDTLDANRIGMWLAQLASEKDPNYTFENVSDEQLGAKLDNIGAIEANIPSLPTDSDAPSMSVDFKPNVLKRGRTDPKTMVTYHEISSAPYKSPDTLRDEAMIDPELQKKFKKTKTEQDPSNVSTSLQKEGGKKLNARKSKKAKKAKKANKSKKTRKSKKTKGTKKTKTSKKEKRAKKSTRRTKRN